MPIAPGHLELITPTIANQVLHHLGHDGYPAGSFITALLNAWDHADPNNHRLLAASFPGYGAAMRLARQSGGADQLQAIANGADQ